MSDYEAREQDFSGWAIETAGEHTAMIVTAAISSGRINSTDITKTVETTFTAVLACLMRTPPERGAPRTAGDLPGPDDVRASITPDHLVSFIDGKHYKTLKRHLAGNDLTPDAYRKLFALPADYPMVAAGYAAKRSELAKRTGLGRRSPA